MNALSALCGMRDTGGATGVVSSPCECDVRDISQCGGDISVGFGIVCALGRATASHFLIPFLYVIDVWTP